MIRQTGSRKRKSSSGTRIGNRFAFLCTPHFGEERARNETAEIREAYETAQSGHVFFRVFSDTFAPGQKHDTAILPPPVGEDFIDRISVKAGGRQLTPEEIGIILQYSCQATTAFSRRAQRLLSETTLGL